MKVLQQVGHNGIWNIDAHYKNDISDGFVFCAYSHSDADLKEKYFAKHKDLIDKSFLDLQYFGKKESGNIDKGNLKSYTFHPAANIDDEDHTDVFIEQSIKLGIKYQIDLGLTNVIIPHFYENDNQERYIGMVRNINKWLITHKADGIKYFMTVPIANHTIIDENKIESLLYCLTDMDIIFDGYYIVCEQKPETMQKISVDFKYLKNLTRIFQVLKKQKFLTIYAYANFDAVVFLATTDIDYITIATFEKLRNFNIKQFLSTDQGGPSKGWYFSEKLLNFIKAQLLDLIRMQNGMSVIENEKNIFSDGILKPNYPWSNVKPDVHKNYLLAVDRLLREVGAIENLKERKEFVLNKIDNAIAGYEELERKNIYLSDQSSKNYHLDIWKSFLLTK